MWPKAGWIQRSPRGRRIKTLNSTQASGILITTWLPGLGYGPAFFGVYLLFSVGLGGLCCPFVGGLVSFGGFW